jgi:hypothetical protein
MMSPAQRLFWARVQKRASVLQPDLSREILAAFSQLRDELGDMNLLQLLQGGRIDEVIQQAIDGPTGDTIFQPLRERIRKGVRDAVRSFAKDLPAAARDVGVAFDILHPNVIEAVRTLESRVINTLKDDIRGTVRQVVERGLQEGRHPRVVAKELRAIIGLAPNQEAAIDNFRRMLVDGDREALSRELRDRRFDSVLDRAFGEGKGLSPEQVDRFTAAYRKNWIAFNAETNARTAALDTQKLSQHLTWQTAVERGDVDGSRLQKTWRGVMDDREREEHVAMEGQQVPYDQYYSNGEMVPGESTFNCRCVSILSLAAA